MYTGATIVYLALQFAFCIAEPDPCKGTPGELQVSLTPRILQSPGYEKGVYPDDLRCLWMLIPDDLNHLIKIRIVDIDLPRDHRCNFDNVEINYEDSIPPYLSFCGNESREVMLIPASSNPTIAFFTGRVPGAMHRGFQLEYSLVEEEGSCPEFQCRHHFECVSRSSVCDSKADCYDGSDEEGCGHKVEEPEVCGTPKIAPELGNEVDRIIGGRVAVPFSWPWQVSIQSNYIWPSGHVCGGALINNLWVLTAAHCMVGTFFKIHRVKLGDSRQFDHDVGEQIRYVEMFYLHPEYSRFTAQNDIALIKLSAPVQFSDTISPVCLPKIGDEVPVGTSLHATGWGDDFVNGAMDVLKQVEIPKMDWQACHDLHGLNREVQPKTMCTGFPNGGHNPCFGDSGGPLMAKTSERWTLYGVVSWGPTTCGEEPTVYSHVPEFMDWIKTTIESY